MADTAISGLPDGGDVQTTDELAVNRSGSNFKVVVGVLAPLDSVATARIDNDAVTFPKMQNISTQTLMGRTTAATGDPEELTATQARTLLNVADGATDDTTVDAHIADATAAHAASAVGFTPNGTIAATEVQAAVQEVRDEAPLISSEDELAGQMQIAVVATLPGSPDANTIYMVTT